MKRKDIPQFGALSSLKVVVSATAIAGPVAGTILAEMGADVIMIENPKKSDMYRYYKYGWPQERRNQRTLSIDAFCDEGREPFVRLLKDADIFIESSVAGTWARKGYTDEVLWEINPAMVIVHISGYGQYGDPTWIKRPSYDSDGQFMSGYAILQGSDGLPNVVTALPTDYFTAYTTVYSALAAYINAKETGKGDSLDLAQYEAALRPQHMFTGLALNTKTSGYNLQENKTPPCSYMHKTKDGKWVHLSPMLPSLKTFQKMFGLEGHPGIPENPKGISKEEPWYQEYIYPAANKWVSEHTIDEVREVAFANYFSYGEPLDYTDMPEHPQFKAHKTLITYYDDTLGGDFTGVAPVPKFTKNPQQIWRGGFLIGADNDDILEELGYSKDEIDSMYAKGILAADKK